MYAGLKEILPVECELIARKGLRHAGPLELAIGSRPVLDWLDEIGAQHIAIHFDLDVLDSTQFRSLLFSNPAAPEGAFDGIAEGSMTIAQVVRLINDVSKVVDVVGLGITEHLPWDALAMRAMLQRLPLLADTQTTTA
ncbi:hypothetical protein [Paraburkholderia sp. BL25I1N1]|uniref:hypothetical protein n=1 Tax=Paraburkholderia sp. BL25I1N1 TaxID=1938804 RepID=UPI000D4E4F61|nr:hypothetical protein [Paraburkholderia sp. BL25I1N1]PRX92061.1 hypothetical protein B0G73_13623 [Paraburkholderia sp. BL25I1N1]